jgi:hypothetical protein
LAAEPPLYYLRSITYAQVVAREGEPVDLGGVPMANREFRDRFLVGFDRSGTLQRVHITLRATVE